MLHHNEIPPCPEKKIVLLLSLSVTWKDITLHKSSGSNEGWRPDLSEQLSLGI